MAVVDSGGGGQLDFSSAATAGAGDGNGGRRRWWTAAAEDSWIFLRLRRQWQRMAMTAADNGGGRWLDFSSMAMEMSHLKMNNSLRWMPHCTGGDG